YEPAPIAIIDKNGTVRLDFQLVRFEIKFINQQLAVYGPRSGITVANKISIGVVFQVIPRIELIQSLAAVDVLLPEMFLRGVSGKYGMRRQQQRYENQMLHEECRSIQVEADLHAEFHGHRLTIAGGGLETPGLQFFNSLFIQAHAKWIGNAD